MAEIQEIPLTSDNKFFTISVELDGDSFILKFSWNGRFNRWMLGIYDADENPIKTGLPLHINWDVFGRFADDDLPQGLLMLYDTTGGNEECGEDELGGRCKLLYYTAE